MYEHVPNPFSFSFLVVKPVWASWTSFRWSSYGWPYASTQTPSVKQHWWVSTQFSHLESSQTTLHWRLCRCTAVIWDLEHSGKAILRICVSNSMGQGVINPLPKLPAVISLEIFHSVLFCVAMHFLELCQRSFNGDMWPSFWFDRVRIVSGVVFLLCSYRYCVAWCIGAWGSQTFISS